MIYGIGTDIVEIERIRRAIERWGDHFLRRVFTGREIAHCRGKKVPFPSFAARFAAKEAFVKAISGPDAGGRTISMIDIEVLNHPSGKPYLVLPEDLAGRYVAGLTLSHERRYAVATVILETKEK